MSSSNQASIFNADSVLPVAVDRAQGVRHGAGAEGDDEHIPAVGIGLAGVEVGCFSHGQARQISNRATVVAGHGDGQSADGVGLVDAPEHAAMGPHRGQNCAQRCFVRRQWLVVDFLACGGQRAGEVAGFTDVEADDDVGCCGRFHDGVLLLRMVTGI